MKQINTKISTLSFFALVFCLIFFACQKKKIFEYKEIEETVSIETKIPKDSILYIRVIDRDIRVKDYFEYLDTIVCAYDSLVPYSITEHLLIRANPRIIDSLAATDYYLNINNGVFIFDQKEQIILYQGDSLLIPNEEWANQIIKQQAETWIDINIPAFELSIYEGEKVLYNFPVRVGQEKKRYLKMAGREVDLKTKTGKGTIVRINKNPRYVNPVNNHRYYQTRRDDNQVTKLPRIPFLEPEIDGHRWGHLIHPTTNENTLGKAYSNGCIGTKEADAWYIYYYAPIGTAITIRYDLETVNTKGDTIHLSDIYGLEL